MVWFNGHFQGPIGLIYEVLDREKLLDLGQNMEVFKWDLSLFLGQEKVQEVRHQIQPDFMKLQVH